MSSVWVIILAITLALLGWTWKLARSLGERRARLVGLEQSLVNLLADRQEVGITSAALLEKQKLVEKSVETGADVAEAVHNKVAGGTFDILDSIPATEGISRFARGLHDGIAGTSYSKVRSSNKSIGGLARVLMKLKDDLPAARSNQSELENGQAKTETTPNNGERQGPDENQY